MSRTEQVGDLLIDFADEVGQNYDEYTTSDLQARCLALAARIVALVAKEPET